ncbi:MAG: glyceraldehyde-3-phosphate dehydrogenase [Bacteroidia bacterium]|nr:MAG: glyceraldehyde-3-phosphate dehydrogenase [Bacteroidia bacterium]
MSKNNLSEQISLQNRKNKAVAEFINLASDLWYENSIELILFRHQIVNRGITEILNLLDYTRRFVEKPIDILEVLAMTKDLKKLQLPMSRLDIGKLTYEFLMEQNNETRQEFITRKLKGIENAPQAKAKDVILYGFGRIGRLIARELVTRTGNGDQLLLRAIVVRGELTEENLQKRASLLRNDSVHGQFPGTVVVDTKNKSLIINGLTIKLINASSPDSVDYTKYEINDAILIDNTGVWRDEKGLSTHLKSKGVEKVILTAPGKGSVPNIVYGVNHLDFSPDEHKIYSAASCTTNAITPVLKVIHSVFGIKQGHIETIHSYTNDQNLVDNYHKKYRRGRAAAINMVITETGAGKAVSKAIPELSGKLTSNAIRVPVPNGSLAILNLKLSQQTDLQEINREVKKACLDGELVEQILYSVNNELVSSDIVGQSAASIYDSNATIVSEDGRNVLLYVWYDNEFGYVNQVIRIAKYVGKVRRYHYY